MTLIPETNAELRVEMLISKKVQIIASVANSTAQKLQNEHFILKRRPGLRNMHFQLAQTNDGREKTPTHIPVQNKATQETMPNPLGNRAFRQALSFAINKQELVNEVMQGSGFITGQYMPEGTVGYIPKIPAQYFDSTNPAKSLRLAREFMYRASIQHPFLAGTPLTIPVHGPKGRYPNDDVLVKKVAQIWTDAFHFEMNGKTFALTFVAHAEDPPAVYFKQNATFLISLLGGGVDNGQIEGALRLYFIPGSGLNAGGYNRSNITELYKQGNSEFDETKRTKLFVSAMKDIVKDYGFIPLFHVEEVVAHDPSVEFTQRIDGLMLGFYVQKK